MTWDPLVGAMRRWLILILLVLLAASGAVRAQTCGLPAAGLGGSCGTSKNVYIDCADSKTVTCQGGTWTKEVGGSGAGDVTGPSSSLDNCAPRALGTSGKAIDYSSSNCPTIGDTGLLSTPGGLDASSAAAPKPFKITTDCSAVTTDGVGCWDSDDNTFCIGTGSTCASVGGGVSGASGTTADVQVNAAGALGTVPGFTANSGTGEVAMRGPVANVKAFGATGDGVADDTAEINAACAAQASHSAGAGGGEVLIPQGVFLVSAPIDCEKMGVRLRGESPSASVIKAASGFSGSAVVILHKDAAASATLGAIGVGVRDLHVNVNNQAAHGILVEKGYDQVSIDNVMVDGCADAFNCLRMVPDPGVTNPISQTVEIRNSSFIKRNTTSTAAAVYLERVQEAVISGSKAFGQPDPGGSAPAATGPAWEMEGVRGISMVGISAAFSAGPCIKITGNTNTVVGVSIIGPTIETCPNILQTSASGINAVQRVAFVNPRYQYNTFDGTMTLNNLGVSYIEASNAAVTVGSTSDQNRILTQRPSTVTDSGTNTEIRSWKNAVDAYASLNQPFAIRSVSTPEYEWRVNTRTPYWRAYWSADASNDFGWQLAYNDGVGGNSQWVKIQGAAGQTDLVGPTNVNGVRAAKYYATAGAGSSGSPYTGWTAAVAANQKTFLESGTYYGLSSALTLPAGSTLECADRSAVIYFTNAAAYITNATNAGDIAIVNCTIDGNDDTLTSSTHGLIEIVAGTGTNYRIANNALLDSGKDAVHFQDGTSGTPTKVYVENNRILTTDRHGIEMAANISDFHILNNTLEGTNETTVGASLFTSDPTATLGEIDGNYVKGSGDNSIRIKGSYQRVRGNTTENGKTDAIRVEADYAIVSNNTIKTPDEWGVKVGQGHDNIVINGNYCVGAGTDNDGNTSDSGHCFGTYTATGGVETRVQNVTIANNTALNGVQDGIHLESFDATDNSKDVQVYGNIVVGATVNGIRATSNSTYNVTSNFVTGSGTADYSLAGTAQTTDIRSGTVKIGNGNNSDVFLQFLQTTDTRRLVWDNSPGQFEFDFDGSLADGVDPTITATTVTSRHFDSPADATVGGSLTLKEPASAGQLCWADPPTNSIPRECQVQFKVHDDGLGASDWLYEIGSDGKIPVNALQMAHPGLVVGTGWSVNAGAGLAGGGDATGSGVTLVTASDEAGFFTTGAMTCSGSSPDAGKAAATSTGLKVCDTAGNQRDLAVVANPGFNGKAAWDQLTNPIDDDSCVGDQARFWYDDLDDQWEFCNANSGTPVPVSAAAGAPTTATYITQTADGTLSNEQALSSLSSGIMRVATTTGVITSLTDSSGIASNISDETGSGALVFATSPTLVTPALGTPSSGTLTNATGLPISTGVSGLGTGVATFLATPSSSNFAAAVTGETGTGAVVFDTSPTLVTPALGTPSSGTLTNATGLPISTGVSGLGTGVATFLGTPSSSNFASAVTGETGTGGAVFDTAPTIATPALTGKIDANNVSVDDDDCTGEQGLFWYDSTDSAFEFCNANSGAPTALGGGSSTLNTGPFGNWKWVSDNYFTQYTAGIGNWLTNSTAQPSKDNIIFVPICSGSYAQTVDHIAVNVATAGGAADEMRMLVYNRDGTTYEPSTLNQACAFTDMNATGTGKKECTLSPAVTIPAGDCIFAAYVDNDTDSTIILTGWDNNNSGSAGASAMSPFGTPDITNALSQTLCYIGGWTYSQAGTPPSYSSLTSPGKCSATQDAPRIWVQAQ